MVLCKYCGQEDAETKVNDEYYHKECYYNYLKESEKGDLVETVKEEEEIENYQVETIERDLIEDEKEEEEEVYPAWAIERMDVLSCVNCIALIIIIIFLVWLFFKLQPLLELLP